MQEVYDFIKQVLIDMGFEDEFNMDTFVREELGLDSSEVVDLSLQIKEKYDISIDLKNDATIKQIIEAILGGKKGE